MPLWIELDEVEDLLSEAEDTQFFFSSKASNFCDPFCVMDFVGFQFTDRIYFRYQLKIMKSHTPGGKRVFPTGYMVLESVSGCNFIVVSEQGVAHCLSETLGVMQELKSLAKRLLTSVVRES